MHRAGLEDVKSKLIVERHEREQETNNNMLMVKVMPELLCEALCFDIDLVLLVKED